MKLLLLFMLLSMFASNYLLANTITDQESQALPEVDYPETDIFLFDADLSQKENVLFNGSNVTRRSGYDNQPYFTKDSESFLFSRDDGYQTDVYEYFLSTGNIKRLTHSKATEFSPTPFPDNQSISFVSDRSASIWYGSREELDQPKLAQSTNDNREPIGYYAWNHKTGDILYWSQYGFTVSLANESSKDIHFISGHALPSTPHIIPGTDTFSFIHRQTNSQDWIKQFDPKTKAITPIAPLLGSNTNYGWAPDGSLLMIEKDVLYRWIPNTQESWEKIADLSVFEIEGANRIAISPDGKKIAIVGLPRSE